VVVVTSPAQCACPLHMQGYPGDNRTVLPPEQYANQNSYATAAGGLAHEVRSSSSSSSSTSTDCAAF
jgi:hypothetical protein